VSDLRLIAHQARWALLGVLRVREAIVFTIVFPVLLLVLFNTIFGRGDGTTQLSGGGRLSTEAYFTAAMTAYAVMSAAFTTLAISLVEQRESGQLKRLRGTPLPPSVFVAGQVLRVVVVSAAMVTALVTIGVLVFGVAVDAQTLARVALYAALGTATMAVLGVALTAVARSSDTASTIAPFIAVILAFISGVFLPPELLPDWLATIGAALPLEPLADGLQRALLGEGPLELGNLLALAAWGAAGLLVAARGFRWEPQTA
jgi:ABC-2 type transport system permease protein